MKSYISWCFSLFLVLSICCHLSVAHAEEVAESMDEEASFDPITRLADLEEDPNAVVHGVNVITGDYTEVALDMASGLVEPLKLMRFYYSSDKRKSRHGPPCKRWEFNHRGYLVEQSDGAFHQFEFQDEKGRQTFFRSAKKAEQGYPFRLHPYLLAFANGYTHFPNPGSSSPHPFSMHMICHRHHAENRVAGGSGDSYSFAKDRHTIGKHKGHLVEEIQRPNGLSLAYFYSQHGELRQVDLRNLRKEVTHTMTFERDEKDSCLNVRFSDGQSVSYRKKYRHCLNDFFLEPCLEVASSSSPPLTYVYHAQNQKMVRREGPDGRFLQVDYYEKGSYKVAGERCEIGNSDPRLGRVKQLVEPVGPGGKAVATYRFIYDINGDGGGTTHVYDAAGHLTRYHYGQDKRLSAIEHYGENERLYSRESFFWTFDGELVTRAFEDGSGNLLYCRSFSYDDRGNLSCEALFGNLTGRNKTAPELNRKGLPKENGCEVYRKHYRYSRRLNLLLEEWDDRTRIHYVYKPESSLLEAKFLFEGKTIRCRHFYEYDQNGAVSLEMTDDGDKEERDNLSQVTERHIRRIVNSLWKLPGAPKTVEELVLDLATGQEMLLHATHHAYDSRGHLTRQEHVDSEGESAYVLAWEYDAHGNVLRETDAMGHVILRSYDGCGNLIREEGPDERVKIFAYDAANRLIREETLDGQISLIKAYVYDKCNRQIAATDEYGQTTRFIYDVFGRLVEKHSPEGIATDGHRRKPIEKREYNAFGQLIALTRADGSVTRYLHNVRGQTLEVQHPDATKECFQYSLDGLLMRTESPSGVTTACIYDYSGRRIREDILNAGGELAATKTKRYSAFHLLISTDEGGAVTQFSYDRAGRLIATAEGERVIEHRYDTLGRCCETRQQGSVKRYEFDKLNRLIEEQQEDDKISRRTIYGYDAAGRRIYVASGQTKVTTRFNGLGEPVCVTDAEGNQTRTHYLFDYINPQGQCVACSEATDQEGKKTISIRDVWGRIVSIEQFHPLDSSIQRKTFDYDFQGRKILEKIQGAGREQLTLWRYDAAGHLLQLTEAAGSPQQKSTQYTYHASCLGSVIKPDGVQLRYAYDGLGRLESLSASDGTLHYTYTYDLYGRICEAEDHIHGFKTQKRYDRYGNCIQEILGNGLSTSSGYDAIGRQISFTIPDGSSIAYSYAGSRIIEVRRNQYCHSYTGFDQNGQYTEARLLGNAGELHVSRDINGRPVEIKTSCWSADYRYDKVGHMIEGSGITYSYDALGQLVEERDQDDKRSYSYDALYNRTGRDGRSFVVDALNQLLEDGERQYVYDRAGRLIRRTFEGRIQDYDYDALDRLTLVTEGTQQYHYVYDHEGRRLSKTLYTRNSQGIWQPDKTIRYLYNDRCEIGSYEGNELKELRILGIGRGAEIGAAVALELNGDVYAPIHDQNGNCVSLVDSEGKTAWRARYTAFGEVIEERGIENPWGYASKRLDPETGWIYFGRRFYDPYSARWTTPDPIGYKGGPNLYAYVLNDPLTHFDREGLFLESISACFSDAFSCFGHSLRLLGDHFLPIPYVRDLFSSFGRVLTGFQGSRLSYSCNRDLRRPEIDPNVRVVSVNGIMNSPEESRSWAENISSYFGDANVHYSYNSSHGFAMDLLECIAQKLGFHTHCEEKLVQLIREQCAEVGEGGAVHLMSHSQGGLVVSNALSHLSPAEREILHVVTFGSATMIGRGDLASAKNYINSGDFVPWISDPFGIVRHSDTIEILRSPLFDHSVISSPSYQWALENRGADFTRIYGRL